MQIKKPRDLTLRDLPNIESPSAAASQIGYLANRPGSPLTWDQSLVQDSPLARPLDQRTFVNRLREKLEKGELLMVYGVTDGRPFNPLVAWREGGSLPARWQVAKSIFGLNLEHKVAQLNDWQITPEQINHLGPGGVGHLSASSFDSDLRAQKAEERAQAKQDQERSLSSPIGAAAAVAPLAVAAQEPEEETKTEKKLHIEVGIFTDGTGNNAGNIDIYREKLKKLCLDPHERGEVGTKECSLRLALMMGASYGSEKTNVFKLFNSYREGTREEKQRTVRVSSIYTSGVGTSTGEDDSLISSATGVGETGILNQADTALEQVVQRIKLYTVTQEIEKLTIDVFGFSRGAATARHVIHEIKQGPAGLLGEKLKRENIRWPKSVKIRFAGLFDTVAGVVSPQHADFSASDAKTKPIHIYLDPTAVEAAVHLTATDECRENFSLNSLANSDGSLPSNFSEISLPGAHSDIGGGYQDVMTEKVMLARNREISGDRTEWPEQTMHWDNLAQIKENTINEGWIGENSIYDKEENLPYIGIKKILQDHPTPRGKVILELEMVRRIRGEYSRVALKIMHTLATESGVPFEKIDSPTQGASLPDELETICQKLLSQTKSGKMNPILSENELKLLKQKYIHHSDNFNSVAGMVGESIATLEVPWDLLLPFKPTEDRIRIVHPNSPEA